MLSVIGDFLGPAIGVALSPMAIVGFILMLVSAGGMPKAWGFIAGWAVGTGAVLVILGLVVSGTENDDSTANNALLGWIRIVLGMLMVGLAWRQWKGRPAHGEAPVLPKWMQAMDKVTPVKAVGLGVVLSAANPKNLPLLITSAGVIGQANLSGLETTASVIIFIVLACLGMLIPIGIFLAAGEKGAAILDAVREWLVNNNATIMAVLFLILGVSIIGKGLGGL
jgi:hypothetical protein